MYSWICPGRMESLWKHLFLHRQVYDTEINDVVVLHYSCDLGRGYGVLPVLNKN